MKIGRIYGIEIRLDLSVAIIFGLVVYSLGMGLFPSWHEDWSTTQTMSLALAAGLLLLASLLAHELAHSVVARLKGIPVPRITLFVFGGVSQMEREPDTPAAEFQIAIAGPATSLALGVLFTSLGLRLAGQPSPEDLYSDPESAMAMVGPGATLMLWLGPVNLILGIFNLIPGFPLDGGRVFRAVAWWLSGDLERATGWATNAGRAVAWGLMAVGALQLLQGGVVQGLWLMLIGWFLHTAAVGSQAQLILRRAVEQLRVRDLMRTRFEVVGPDLSVSEFLDEFLLRSAQPAWPVVEHGRLLGIVTLDDVREIPSAKRGDVTVRRSMRPIEEYVRPELAGRQALEVLLGSKSDPVPVMDGERIVGLLHRADIMRWLALHQLKATVHG